MNKLEKYIFDPENPHKCRVYNLLLKILRKKDNAAFIAPYFFAHIFEKEFSFIKEELWDVPDNFDSLDIVEKINLYISQFSHLELDEQIKKRFGDNNAVSRLFNKFLGLYYYSGLSIGNFIMFFTFTEDGKMKALSAGKGIPEGEKEVKELFGFVTGNADNFKAYDMEKEIFSRVMLIGMAAMKCYFAEKGTGDAGDQLISEGGITFDKESALRSLYQR